MFSFVGLVYVLKRDSTKSYKSCPARLQNQMKGLFERECYILLTTCTIFTISPKICKQLQILMFLINILNDKCWSTCINLLFVLLQSRDCVNVVTWHTLQKSQLLKFYLLFVRIYRGNELYLLTISSNAYEISHNDSKIKVKIPLHVLAD